jgi:uncharacterized membrane protein
MTQTQYRPTPSAPGPPERPVQTHRWRHPLMFPLAVVIVGFLLYVLPPYIHLNPATSLVTLNPHFPLHYTVVILHILCGSIALLTLLLQIWPYVLERSPKTHRIAGRFYVFAAIPAAIFGLILAPFGTPTNGNVGSMGLGLMWLFVTIKGFMKARQGRYEEHRRWMIYSFVVGVAPIWGRIFYILIGLFPSVGNHIDPGSVAELAGWAWVGNVLIAQWWIEKTARAKRKPVF